MFKVVVMWIRSISTLPLPLAGCNHIVILKKINEEVYEIYCKN